MTRGRRGARVIRGAGGAGPVFSSLFGLALARCPGRCPARGPGVPPRGLAVVPACGPAGVAATAVLLFLLMTRRDPPGGVPAGCVRRVSPLWPCWCPGFELGVPPPWFPGRCAGGLGVPVVARWCPGLCPCPYPRPWVCVDHPPVSTQLPRPTPPLPQWAEVFRAVLRSLVARAASTRASIAGQPLGPRRRCCQSSLLRPLQATRCGASRGPPRQSSRGPHAARGGWEEVPDTSAAAIVLACACAGPSLPRSFVCFVALYLSLLNHQIQVGFPGTSCQGGPSRGPLRFRGPSEVQSAA